jgi:glycosyltransferase involved in cell wall biosynthesis
MKIIYLLGSLNRGGTETLILDLVKNIKKSDFDFLVLHRKSGALKDDFYQSGIQIKPLKSGNFLKIIWHLRFMVKKEKVNIIHAQQPIDLIYAYVATIGLKTKVVMTMHGFDFEYTGKDKKILELSFKYADKNLFVSEYQAAYFKKEYGLNAAKVLVHYNALALEKFEHSGNNNYLRKELHLKNNFILLGTVGNFVPVRDHMIICRFLKQLRDNHINFHFVFAGSRSDKYPELYDNCVEYCRTNKLESQVTFSGSRNDIPTFLPQLDAFIYATNHDTFGIAVIEAIASGIPVFVNNWPVMEEVTENGKMATLYPTGDEEALMKLFEKFLNNRPIYSKKAVDSANMVKSKYQIDKHVNNLKDIYGQILK